VNGIEEFVARSITWIAPVILVLLRLHLGVIVAPKLIDPDERHEMRMAELVETPSAFGFAALGLVSVGAARAYVDAPGRGPFLSVLVFAYVALLTYTLFFGFQVRRTGEFASVELSFALILSIFGLFIAAVTTASI